MFDEAHALEQGLKVAGRPTTNQPGFNSGEFQ